MIVVVARNYQAINYVAILRYTVLGIIYIPKYLIYLFHTVCKTSLINTADIFIMSIIANIVL